MGILKTLQSEVRSRRGLTYAVPHYTPSTIRLRASFRIPCASTAKEIPILLDILCDGDAYTRRQLPSYTFKMPVRHSNLINA